MSDLTKIIEDLCSVRVVPGGKIGKDFDKENDHLRTKAEDLREEYEAKIKSIQAEKASLQSKMFRYFFQLLKRKYGQKISLMVAAEGIIPEYEEKRKNICPFENFVEPENLELRPEDRFVFIAVTIEDVVLGNQLHDSARSFLKSYQNFVPLTNIFRTVIGNLNPRSLQWPVEEMEKWIIRMIDIK